MAQQFSSQQLNSVSARSRTAVSAVHDGSSRRKVIGGLIGLTALLPATSFAVTEIEIFDDRKSKKYVDRLIEAMDETLTQGQREGTLEAKTDLKKTKERLIASKDILKNNVRPKLDSQYWWETASFLRMELGTLRSDLLVVAQALPREQRREAFKLKKSLFQKIEQFDKACGAGIKPETADKELAVKLYNDVMTDLDTVLSAVAVA